MTFAYAYSLKNNEVTLTNCDREPVHVPGCIQPHGVLVALDARLLTILQVSDNASEWLGASPERMLGTPIAQWAGEEIVRKLRLLLDGERLGALPRFVCRFTVNGKALDALAHLHDGLLLLECEAAQEAQPAENLFAEIGRITARLRESEGLKPFCEALAAEVRALTGLDRVMVYRFQEDLSGEVFAEDKREDLCAYLGLHYPAEDIPQPAREIFRKIWVRPLPAAEYQPSEMMPLINPLTSRPLDMTYCFLRGASVMYTDYLRNMGVAMSLTLSLVVDGKLWGLVACHHYSPKIVPWPQRAACELLAQMASLQLSAAENRDLDRYRNAMREKARRFTERLLADGSTLAELLDGKPSLLDYFDADGVAVLEDGKWHVRGQVPGTGELAALAQWVQGEHVHAPLDAEILHTHALFERFAPAESYAATASGLLAMPLARGEGEMVMWFRREVVQVVNWAGDPHSKNIVDGPGGARLLPRSSFALWQEQLRNHSLPWTKAEVEGARQLRLSMMEALVARSQGVKKLNRALAESNEELDAFAYVTSHDLREPLRGIFHYANHLRDRALEQDDEESQTRAESLLRLTRRMDMLVESLLHFSRLGRTELHREPVDMRELVEEAHDILLASRPARRPEIRIEGALPTVEGDAVRLRELWLNLLANAVKYNRSDAPRITIRAEDNGSETVFIVADNGIGIEPKHRDIVFQLFKRLHGKTEYGGGGGAGLAIVKKIVERHHGRIWVEESEEGGAKFCFTLPGVRR